MAFADAAHPAAGIDDRRRRRAADAEWRLVLPLGVFMILFFAAPLLVLLVVSLFGEPEMRTLGLAQYTRFLGDRFTLGILLDTLVLGAEATIVCLVFGLP